MGFVERNVAKVGAVVVSDYNKGLLSPPVLRAIIHSSARHKVPVLLDPNRGRDFSLYRGATAVTPNRFETEIATGITLADEASALAAARKLIRMLKLQYAVITLDKDGIYLCGRNGKGALIPPLTEPKAVTDITGAGDMVISVLGLLVAGGVGFEDAARLANVAAGIEVTKIGVVPVSRMEIINELMFKHRFQPEKVLSAGDLARVLKTHRQRKEKIVFTNGCFDILHIGHVRYLDFARAQGDILVVGVNTDRSVRVLKGEHRPIVPQEDRARLLASLESVDYVTLFNEDTPLKLIRKVRPDVLVKGEDWRDKGVVGQDVVEAAGGKVALAPLVKGRSTTNVVETILRRFRKHSDKG
jgi:D-beta-D-heptose 7-phosphate kinase/D-beta-D-heptose 1-phosphate adenosyltransferase